jgi:hypothetical protein
VAPDLKLNRSQFLKLFKELINEHLQNRWYKQTKAFTW